MAAMRLCLVSLASTPCIVPANTVCLTGVAALASLFALTYLSRLNCPITFRNPIVNGDDFRSGSRGDVGTQVSQV